VEDQDADGRPAKIGIERDCNGFFNYLLSMLNYNLLLLNVKVDKSSPEELTCIIHHVVLDCNGVIANQNNMEWQVILNMVLKLRFSLKAGNFFAS
jgi:hypothetical protein